MVVGSNPVAASLTSENLSFLWFFQGLEKGYIANEWGKNLTVL